MSQNPSHYTTGTRKVFYALRQFTIEAGGDWLLNIGQPSVSGVPFGEATLAGGGMLPVGDRGAWASLPDPTQEYQWNESIPVSFTARNSVPVLTSETTGGLHTNHLITLDGALEALADHAAKFAARGFNKMRLFDSFKSYAALGPLTHAVGRASVKAVHRLWGGQYTKNKTAHGYQRVYTRNWKAGRVGRRYGKPAYRRGRGRTPLSAAQWKLHYLERLAKRRKTTRRGNCPPGCSVKIPPTKDKRPGRPIEGPGLDRDKTILRYAQPLLDEHVLRDKLIEKFVHKLSHELGSGVGDWIGEKFKSAIEKWMGK